MNTRLLSKQRWNERFLFLSLIGWLLTGIGCGPSVGKVSGSVTIGGKPVPAGLITFRPENPEANTISAELDRQGRFTVELPVGPCRIAIDNRQHEPLPKAGVGVPMGLGLSPEVMAKLRQTPTAAEAPPAEVDPTTTADAPQVREAGLYIKLPEKVYLVETSGLSIDVKPGEQVENVEL